MDGWEYNLPDGVEVHQHNTLGRQCGELGFTLDLLDHLG